MISKIQNKSSFSARVFLLNILKELKPLQQDFLGCLNLIPNGFARLIILLRILAGQLTIP